MKKINKTVLVTIVAVLAVVISRSAYWGGCPDVDPIHYTVLIPDDEDCRSFYLCSNGVPIHQVCDDGLWFCPALAVCDWPGISYCDYACDPYGTGGGTGGGSEPEGFEEKYFENPFILVYDEGWLSLYRWEKGHTCEPTGDLISCTPKCEFCETHNRGYSWTGWSDCANI